MSGGAFNYRDNIIFELRDSVAREIGLYEYGGSEDYYQPKDPRTIKYMKQVCKELGKLGKIMHSLDWYLSGDTGEDDFINDYESIYKEDK